MEKSKSFYNISILLFSIFLSVAIVIAASIIANSIKEFSNISNTIDVKGLAIKNIKSDNAIFVINIHGKSSIKEEAYINLENQIKKVLSYLKDQKINQELITRGDESLERNYKYLTKKIDDNTTEQQEIFQYYLASGNLTIKSTDVNKIAKIYSNINKFFELHNYTATANSPKYLVSNLEDIKMSLIADATANAKTRADEFAKSGNIKVGSMKSATQGVFNIIATDRLSDNDDYYGGTYDKTTIEKIAKVVVTIKFGIK